MILHEEGLPQVWARHATLACSIWAAFDAWGQGHSTIRLNVPSPAHRGHSVTATHLAAPDATRMRQWCEANAGVTLGICLGMATAEDLQATGSLRVASRAMSMPT